MATRLARAEPPLVVIVGPTASGKTSLAVQLAERFGGEIICADSRTVYTEMDIGTAKPTLSDRARVLHWGIDIINPDQRFTAADFQHYALDKITEIRARGHIPFLVGGTGLYIDSVIFGYQFAGDHNALLRNKLNQMSLANLQKYCIENNIIMPENYKNRRYIIRTIEQDALPKKEYMPISNCIIVGITTEKTILRERITHRVEQLFESGVVEESIMLGKKYGWENESMTANVYRIVKEYLDNDLSIQQAIYKNIVADWRLAKRQLTWLKRNQYIEWKKLADADHYLSDILARYVAS